MNSYLANATNNTKFALSALGGVETDFNCSGACKTSLTFTFSNVTHGPPSQNCSIAVEHFAVQVAKTARTWFWLYFALTLFAALYLVSHWSKEHNKLRTPLLGKNYE